MLELQFILTFQNTDYIVDEPDGFTSFNSVLERDFDTHGVFFRFTDNDLKLKFPGSGREVLKSARDGFGIDASVGLTVKRKFRSTDTFVTIYTGNAVMENLEVTREYASVDFEELNTMIKIKDRLDVPVRSTQTTDFDGNVISEATETAFTMGAKTIQKVSSMKINSSVPVLSDDLSIINIPSTTGLKFDSSLDYTGVYQFQRIKNEIKYKNGNEAISLQAGELEDVANPSYYVLGGLIVTYPENNDYTVDFEIDGGFSLRNFELHAGRGDLIFQLVEKSLLIDGTTEITNTDVIKSIDLSAIGGAVISPQTIDYSVSKTISGGTKTFEIRAFVEDNGSGTNDQHFTISNPTSDFTFTATIDTAEPDTDVNGYFLHEALRHNVQVVAGSDILHAPFFGRTADGYEENGCAWNYTESNGWRIRGFSNALNMDLKTRLNSLKAIFGIGYGLEREEEASETYRFRVDQAEYWYNENLLYEFDDVVDYKEEFFDWFSFNEVEVGYKKYSNDEDEPGTTEDFNSSASWLMPVERLRGKKSFLSDYIGSDLLAEITRRLQFEEKPTTSNRYDDDIFLQEVKSDGSGGWEIGTDQNVGVLNEVNPAFNVLINPKFNFFNQSPLVNTVAYKKLITDEYKNTSFKYGNDIRIFYQLTAGCLGDLRTAFAGDQTFDMDADISVSQFRDGQRLFDPIKVSFKTALKTEQIEDIIEAHRNGMPAGVQEEGNNYGFIRITSPDGEQIEGWLLKLSFNFADQIGNFELIKKANAYSI